MKKALLVGYGHSNRALEKYLSKHGYQFKVITDRDDSTLALLNELPLFDEAFISPGVRPQALSYNIARLCSAQLNSELNYSLRKLPAKCRVILVTGSNGKTTVASMLAYALRYLNNDVMLAGNIGLPLIAALEYIKPGSFVIVEVSSFQAELMFDQKPEVVVYTSIAPNHLDSYVSYEAYKLAKKRLVKGAKKVLATEEAAQELNLTSYCSISSSSYAKAVSYSYAGQHNVFNIALVYETIEILALDSNKLPLSFFRHFSYPTYRESIVYEDDHLLIVNDSKSTSAQATLTALRRFDCYPTILIVGGHAKSDLSVLKDKCASILVYGPEREQTAKILDSTYLYPDMESALIEALKIARERSEKTCILFSPAGSSLQYSDYMERGKKFSVLVRENV